MTFAKPFSVHLIVTFIGKYKKKQKKNTVHELYIIIIINKAFYKVMN